MVAGNASEDTISLTLHKWPATVIFLLSFHLQKSSNASRSFVLDPIPRAFRGIG